MALSFDWGEKYLRDRHFSPKGLVENVSHGKAALLSNYKKSHMSFFI